LAETIKNAERRQASSAHRSTLLLRSLIEEASRARKPLRIHVEQFNPALRLYQRLGFQTKGTNGVYFLMELWPETNGEG